MIVGDVIAQRLARRIGVNVRHFRLELKSTVKAVSARSEGIHWRHWQKIELGESNVTLWTLTRLAIALGVDAHALLAFSHAIEKEGHVAGEAEAAKDADALESELLQRFALNVRTLRNSMSLTLETAAERSNGHWRHWQKMEAGEVNVTLKTIARVANALQVDPSRLFTPSLLIKEGLTRTLPRRPRSR